jgi:ankyrin repeat protein
LGLLLQHGMTSLHLAAYRGCREVVGLLLGAGAQVNVKGKVRLPP